MFVYGILFVFVFIRFVCFNVYCLFQCLLGQRYGPTNLPMTILHNEFEQLRNVFLNRQNDLELLHQWYIKDSNAIPALYVLQPISKVLGRVYADPMSCLLGGAISTDGF